jgi:hypothetical protein
MIKHFTKAPETPHANPNPENIFDKISPKRHHHKLKSPCDFNRNYAANEELKSPRIITPTTKMQDPAPFELHDQDQDQISSENCYASTNSPVSEYFTI